MSDKWLHIQREETRGRNREIRLAAQREAQRLADRRAAQRQEPRS